MNLNTMKNLVLIIALTLSLVAVSDAQVTAGFRIGYAQTVKPNTDYLLFNMQDPGNEMLFNVNEVRNFGQFSLMLRTDKRPFWFVAELMYGQSKTTYVTRYIRNFMLH